MPYCVNSLTNSIEQLNNVYYACGVVSGKDNIQK